MSKQPSSIEQSVESAKTFADKSKNSDDVHVTTSEEGTTPSTLDQPRSDSTTEGDAYYPEGKSSYEAAGERAGDALQAAKKSLLG
ncbi:hypothetical protein ABBQ32_007155 [Trebouxia sp. C0010 RCD-2024]